MGDIFSLVGLFVSAFLSATVVPAQSELALGVLLSSGHYPAWLLLMLASTGNTLGALVNWGLGRGIARFEGENWFPVRRASLVRAERWFARFGAWVLLLSWVPVVGDPLTVVAGLLRMRFLPFLVVVALAKTGRYVVIWLVLPVL